MTKFSKIIYFCIATGFLSACSQVLQSVDLKINTKDNSLQEEFNVIEKTLTIKEARAQKSAPYLREVLRVGRGDSAQPIPEKLALKSEFPKNSLPEEYKIGIGDTLALSKLIENNRSNSETENQWPTSTEAYNYRLGIGDTLALTLIKTTKSTQQLAPSGESENGIITSQQVDETINSRGRIGSDGSVLLLEVGRLEANGKSLNELRSEVRNILIRNGVSPRFQLEIDEFKSQKAYLTVNSTSGVIILDDQIQTVKDILTSANVGFSPGVTTRIRIQRDRKEYVISLREIYDENAPKLDVRSNDHIFVEDSSANIKTTFSKVDHQGNVVFENLGKIKAAGNTISEMSVKIENLIRPVPDSQNAFQIQITEFASQTAFLSINGKPRSYIQITDKPAKLSEALTQADLSVDSSNVIQISLHRDGKVYVFTLDDLLNPNSQTLYINPEDTINVSILPYKENKVFILGGVSPQIFKINPAKRETLADILFTSGGPLRASSAKRSEVYLLRGSDPIVAYHLDAQSPTRLVVADAMELRPNDILYVAEQPIISFNRALGTIVPLRVLLRDIQDENIP